MDIIVPDSILSETKKCRHNFSCLGTQTCGHKKICEVEKVHSGGILFLVPKEQLHCPYRLSFGEGQICLCPTHYHIKNKIQKK